MRILLGEGGRGRQGRGRIRERETGKETEDGRGGRETDRERGGDKEWRWETGEGRGIQRGETKTGDRRVNEAREEDRG